MVSGLTHDVAASKAFSPRSRGVPLGFRLAEIGFDRCPQDRSFALVAITRGTLQFPFEPHRGFERNPRAHRPLPPVLGCGNFRLGRFGRFACFHRRRGERCVRRSRRDWQFETKGGLARVQNQFRREAGNAGRIVHPALLAQEKGRPAGALPAEIRGPGLHAKKAAVHFPPSYWEGREECERSKPTIPEERISCSGPPILIFHSESSHSQAAPAPSPRPLRKSTSPESAPASLT